MVEHFMNHEKNKSAVDLGRLGGLSKSPAKIKAAKANGRKGGRPKMKREGGR